MINSVVLFGRLTADPDTKSVGDNKTVTTFRIAVERLGAKPRNVDYVSVECWGGLADASGQHLHKGRAVGVQGALRHDEWTGSDGQRHSRLYVVANHVQFTDTPPTAAPADEHGDTTVAA
jgi:single-strand DNA-binding protein